MPMPQIVLDTNIIVSGLRSKRGSAFRLLTLVGTGLFEIHLSVPLVLEYQDVLSRTPLSITATDIEDLIAFHCSVATCHRIFFLWRPFLPDPKDDMVLELAVKAGCDSVVTYNARDFVGIEQFGYQSSTACGFFTCDRSLVMSSLNVQLPDSLYQSLQELAKQDGISVDQFIVTAVAEKIEALTSESCLEALAKRGSREKYEAVLAKVPDVAPEPYDQ